MAADRTTGCVAAVAGGADKDAVAEMAGETDAADGGAAVDVEIEMPMELRAEAGL